MDYSGRDRRLPARNQNEFPDDEATPLFLGLRAQSASDEVMVSVTYDRPVTIDAVRLVEGATSSGPQAELPGGWLESPVVWVRGGNEWVRPPGGGTLRAPQRDERAFEIL